MAKIGLMPEIVTRYRSPYFRHIFVRGGYSAGYYSYIWSEVLDTDAFQAFKEKGIFDPATALSFRTNVDAEGGQEGDAALVRLDEPRPVRGRVVVELRGDHAGVLAVEDVDGVEVEADAPASPARGVYVPRVSSRA